tara:strand:- start:487 stop:1194 length:708 start_codon:yes stop_codon:yes gene_type:complete
MSKVIFISPMYNATAHLPDLIQSMKEQTNDNWQHILVDDMSTDGSFDLACKLTRNDDHFILMKNQEKRWALQNVINVARKYENNSDVIIANIDADDALCNENTVDIILKAYKDPELDTAWTAHSWDINGMNISRELPEKINPYQFPWCTSHLKTWRATTLAGVHDDNFKDLDGNWFRRGYDQALYLPLLYLSHKRKFINETCYLYRINSKSVETRIWSEKDQMDTVRLVRARGFV